MGENEKKEALVTSTRVPIAGYVALIFAIVFFSGVFAAEKGALGALNFNIINGKFGTLKDFAKATFYGGGGIGARDGFLFAITLFPGVMLALGIVEGEKINTFRQDVCYFGSFGLLCMSIGLQWADH